MFEIETDKNLIQLEQIRFLLSETMPETIMQLKHLMKRDGREIHSLSRSL